jgi:hypothetical protein
MLSLPSIRREADMKQASSWAMRARSFGTKVPQDDANPNIDFQTQPLPRVGTDGDGREAHRFLRIRMWGTSRLSPGFPSVEWAVRQPIHQIGA